MGDGDDPLRAAATDWGLTSSLDAARHATVAAADIERQTRLANVLEAGVPSAKVIRLPNVHHYIFRSNGIQLNDLRRLVTAPL